jgi:protein involved in polysaccharide export with SLBB domain
LRRTEDPAVAARRRVRVKKRSRTVGFFGALLGVAVLAIAALTIPSARAAESFGTLSETALPAGISPQQAEIYRKLLETNPEVRKAVEDAQRRKEQGEPQARKPSGTAETAPRAEEQALRTEGPGVFQRYDWRTSTYVGNLFAKRLTDNEASTTRHFGHEIFQPAPGMAQLLENIPVAPGYVIGPGDEIVVKMWGRVEGTQRATVDRDGKIFLPKFGSLYVAGKSFEEMRAFLRAKVSTIAEVRSDVTLGQMKGIRVSVVGEVRSPGWYNVSSFQTALQILSIAGGVKDIGSLRRIQVLREGKRIQEIDLYDLLLSGDTRADIRLQQGDVIFVPVVGKLAAVVGEVRRPAIYELGNEKSLTDLIRVAGGFAPSAWKQRVQVERLEGNVSRIVLDASVDELEGGGEPFTPLDGDIVRVFAILPLDVNVATLEGNVYRPGKYEIKPGMTVGSLLKSTGDFLPETYFEYALLTRLVPPDLHKELVPVNLREIVLEKKPGADIALQARDKLTVYNRSSFRDLPKATISGEVRLIRRDWGRIPATDNILVPGLPDGKMPADNVVLLDNTVFGVPSDNAVLPFRPGTPFYPDNVTWLYRSGVPIQTDNVALLRENGVSFEIQAGTRVVDLVKMAGGLTRLASLQRAEIVRVDADRVYRTIYFDLGKAMEGDPKENVLLENEDRVRIHSVLETTYRKTVSASGEVNNPGDYVLTRGMRLSDLLFKAGGFKESAYVKEAELVRREVSPQGDLVKTQTQIVHPEKVLSGDAAADVLLQEYDLLVVRRIPDWAEKIRITLDGEVQFTGQYTVRKGERLSSVIRRAGGFTKDAYLKAAVFTRVSTQQSQQEAIDRLIADLEIEVAQKSQQVGGALDQEDLLANKELNAARRSLIQQLKKTRAMGRVIIRLPADGVVAGTTGDIILENGDRLVVPRKLNVVNVVGRVYNPTGVVYDPANDSVDYYLQLVGGPTESADRDHIFLLKADGSVVTRDNAGGGFFSFGQGGLLSSKVEPGDSVLVPEKLVQVRFMKDVKDITQILYQIAVTAGVLILAF